MRNFKAHSNGQTSLTGRNRAGKCTAILTTLERQKPPFSDRNSHKNLNKAYSA